LAVRSINAANGIVMTMFTTAAADVMRLTMKFEPPNRMTYAAAKEYAADAIAAQKSSMTKKRMFRSTVDVCMQMPFCEQILTYLTVFLSRIVGICVKNRSNPN
jgi:hypothetical protein